MNYLPEHKDEGYDWNAFRTLIPAYPATIEFDNWLDGETILDAYTEVDGVIWNLELIFDDQRLVRRCSERSGNQLMWGKPHPDSEALARQYFACLLMERAL